jgi:DNA invertase Pin-like site-specific DNA recombinase
VGFTKETPDSVSVDRRIWIQAVALFVVLTAEGIGILRLGGPRWLTVLYVVLGVAFAAGRVRVATRSPAPEPAPREESGPPPAPAPPREPHERRAVGYVRVAHDGLGRELAAHSAAIRAWADERKIELTRIVHDVESGARDTGARPALCGVLERLADGEAETLVVDRLGHLSSTVAKLPPLLSWFDSNQRTLVALDIRLDTATEAGRLAAFALAGVGGWEHERLSARTRRGLEAARARGSANGRASVGDVPELRERITRMRDSGMTLQAIADVLNEEGVPTLRGGAMWRPSSVQRATGYRRPPSQRPDLYLSGSGPAADGPAPAG